MKHTNPQEPESKSAEEIKGCAEKILFEKLDEYYEGVSEDVKYARLMHFPLDVVLLAMEAYRNHWLQIEEQIRKL